MQLSPESTEVLLKDSKQEGNMSQFTCRKRTGNNVFREGGVRLETERLTNPSCRVLARANEDLLTMLQRRCIRKDITILDMREFRD